MSGRTEVLRQELRQAYHDIAWLGGADHDAAWAEADDRLMLLDAPAEALRCPVCEGLDYPGLIHNPNAPDCTDAASAVSTGRNT